MAIQGVAPVGQEAFVKSMTAGMLQLNGLQGAARLGAGDLEANTPAFQQLLSQAIEQTAKLQEASETKKVQFLTGEVEDLHQVMIAQEKAGLAFQLTMQMRNKMLEAYQEIMRMQI